MDLTAMRKEILAKLEVQPNWYVRVLVGRTEGADSFDAVFNVRIATGPEDESNMEALDRLMDPDGGVKEMLNSVEWTSFDDLSIVRCSGHTAFPAPDGPPFVGAEWTVKVMA